MDYHARWYSPTIGRFTQPDTILPNLYDPQSLNRYGYVSNNPMNYVDPSGHRVMDNPGGGGKKLKAKDEKLKNLLYGIQQNNFVKTNKNRSVLAGVYGIKTDAKLSPSYVNNTLETVKAYAEMIGGKDKFREESHVDEIKVSPELMPAAGWDPDGSDDIVVTQGFLNEPLGIFNVHDVSNINYEYYGVDTNSKTYSFVLAHEITHGYASQGDGKTHFDNFVSSHNLFGIFDFTFVETRNKGRKKIGKVKCMQMLWRSILLVCQ
jgi:hypothetical protein